MSKKLSNKEFEELAERRRREQLPFLYGWNWYSWAWDFFQSTNRFNFLCAANQISKAVYIYEDVATPDGFKKMRDIQIGDEVISQSGKKTKVIDIPFFGEEKSYKITFNDGSHVICGENHEWICKGPRERFRKTYTSRWSRTKLKKMWKNPTYNKWIVKSVKDIIKHVGYTDNISPTKKYSIPVSLPVEYDEKILFDPYFVGLWIGNGSGHSITFNSDDTDLEEYCLRYGNRYNTDKVIIGFKNSFQEKIKSLNLGDYSIEKNIPSMYLFGSIEQRKNLLAGLMDTDGTCDRSGQNYSYSTTSEKLAEQVLQLVCSLGGIGRIERRKAGYKKNGEYIKCNDCFVVNMTTIFNPFKSKRKSGRWRLNTRYKHERIIESIQCVGNLKVKCITVAEDDGSFLVTNKYIVTHNSSTQIRKAIHWATEGSLWEGLWPGKTPTQFWYLYPTRPIATSEFYEKWEPEFLPRGEMKKDPKYGWDMEIKNKEVHAIHFKSGVSIYFKTYEQDVHHLQTSTVYSIFCFSGDTLIKTKFGIKRIKDICVNDLVLSKDGFNKVTKIYKNRSRVFEAIFSNGEALRVTGEHPFFTQRGWVKLIDLTSNDLCFSLPLWKLQKRLFYLTESFIHASQGIRILGRKIILLVATVLYFMWNCGKNIIKEACPKTVLYIIKILIHWIIGLKIYNFLLGQSIHAYIKKLSGGIKRRGRLLVNGVKKIFYQGVPKNRFQDIVQENVLLKVVKKLENVSCVKKFFAPENILNNASVVKITPILEDTWVYNLEVENSHTYFANGLLVHNCDEELPYNLFPELRARLTATNGYYHMVFTATMGQEEWRRTIEPKSSDEELFRGAFKKQVSLYDCLTYKDGTKTFWTIERIKEIEQQCVSEAEVLKRVYGKFILTGGLKCLGFERTRNVVKRFNIPSDWAIYSGVDIGSGGENSHPAAITMIAVRPDYKKGVVFKGWRGDGVVTASNDILVKHEELMTYEVPDGGGGLKKFRYVTAGQTYDWQAKDFFTIASRAGISFTPANKGREQGEQLVNTLFKLGMLVIFEGDVELEKLITEIVTLKTDTAKQVAKDDFYDSMRYCVMNIPWDFEGAAGEIIKNYVEEGFVDERSERQKHWDERRGGPEPADDYQETLDDEMEEWQSLVDIT